MDNNTNKYTDKESLQALENIIKSEQDKLDDLRKQYVKLKTKVESDCQKESIRVPEGMLYWCLLAENGILKIKSKRDCRDMFSDNCLNENNYFESHDHIKDIKYKVDHLLRLEILHDIMCPSYKPNWNDKDEDKFMVYKNENTGYFGYQSVNVKNFVPATYFPDEKIADNVCRILNNELKAIEL